MTRFQFFDEVVQTQESREEVVQVMEDDGFESVDRPVARLKPRMHPVQF